MSHEPSTDPGPFAIDGPLPSSSLALEASAGTGKTWTLTSLVVRYVVEDGLSLHELLVVTFTRAATAELVERVRHRLVEARGVLQTALERGGHPGELDAALARIVATGDGIPHEVWQARLERVERALAGFDDATITTIHGFCRAMLQHAALEAGIDVDAELLEDDQALVEEVVDDLLARELRPASPALVRYLRARAGANRDDLHDLVRAVGGLPSLRIAPELPDDVLRDLAPWEEALADLREVWDDGGAERFVTLIERLRSQDAFARPKQRTYTASTAVAMTERVAEWLASAPSVPPPAPPATRDAHRDPSHPYLAISNRSLSGWLAPGVGPVDDPVVTAADALAAAAHTPATRFRVRVARLAWEELDRRKRRRGLLTFDDLLRRLAAALDDPVRGPAVRQTIRRRYRVALIDEFQDTDPLQWRIFRSMFLDDEPMVLIGDPKQAIYAFRGADIDTYLRARSTRRDHRTLTTNHRSDPGVIAATNELFGPPGAFATDQIVHPDINGRHPRRLHDDERGVGLQLRLITRQTAGTASGKPIAKAWADDAVPRDVARVAAELLDGRQVLGGEEPTDRRALTPGDLAVLVRTRRRAQAVRAALLEAGLPAVIDRVGSVFATDEADAMTRLLVALHRPNDQRAAVAAAASLIFARDAATLDEQLRSLDTAATGHAAAHAADAWERWIEALTRWSERLAQVGVLAAVQAAFEEDGVVPRLLGGRDGERRVTNLRHLLELLHEQETRHGRRGHRLLDWLQQQRREAADGAPPAASAELRLEADDDAITIATIHGSKGLQYPVVLCPDLWDGRVADEHALTKVSDPTATGTTGGLLLDLGVDPQDPAKQAHLATARAAALAEHRRLTYVALTRAEHRTVVWWGPVNDAGDAGLAPLLHGRPDGHGGSWLDHAALTEHLRTATDQQLRAELDELATASGGNIAVAELQATTSGPAWSAPATSATPLAASSFDRQLDRSWRRTSFSALIRATDPEARLAASLDEDAPADHGADDVDTPRETVITGAAPEVPLADLPRGAGPGTFLHEVLEHVDLAATATDDRLETLIGHAAARHGLTDIDGPQVARGLRTAIRTPLGGDLGDTRLHDLTRSDRLDELRFELPLAGGDVPSGHPFDLAALGRLLAGSADPLIAATATRLAEPALAGAVRGYLTGSIDVLARLPDGRALVIDHKSNWLGDRLTGESRPEHYRSDALAAVMLDHHYVLQAVLYLVAAHRYLRSRRAAGTPPVELAGAAYLFLRGMTGPDHPGRGVVHLAPEPALLEAISDLLDGRR